MLNDMKSQVCILAYIKPELDVLKNIEWEKQTSKKHA